MMLWIVLQWTELRATNTMSRFTLEKITKLVHGNCRLDFDRLGFGPLISLSLTALTLTGLTFDCQWIILMEEVRGARE